MSKKIRILSVKDKKRLEKLNDLRTKLESGDHVQNKTLKNSLLTEEYEKIFMDWNYQKDIRKEISSKPSSVVEYEERLKKALLLYNRGNKYSQQGKHVQAKKLIHQSQSEFEQALTYLESEVKGDTSLHMWFDRSLDFGHQSQLGLDPQSVPRAITSRSVENQSSGFSGMGVMTKRDVKIQVINNAIENLIHESETDEDESEKIQGLLKKLRQQTSPTVKWK